MAAGPIQRAFAAVSDLGTGHASGGVVTHKLGDPDGLARLPIKGEYGFGEVRHHVGGHSVFTGRVHEMLISAGQCHRTVRALKAKDHRLLGGAPLALEPRNQNSPIKLSSLARVHALTQRCQTHVVFILAVLAVEKLR